MCRDPGRCTGRPRPRDHRRAKRSLRRRPARYQGAQRPLDPARPGGTARAPRCVAAQNPSRGPHHRERNHHQSPGHRQGKNPWALPPSGAADAVLTGRHSRGPRRFRQKVPAGPGLEQRPAGRERAFCRRRSTNEPGAPPARRAGAAELVVGGGHTGTAGPSPRGAGEPATPRTAPRQGTRLALRVRAAAAPSGCAARRRPTTHHPGVPAAGFRTPACRPDGLCPNPPGAARTRHRSKTPNPSRDPRVARPTSPVRAPLTRTNAFMFKR